MKFANNKPYIKIYIPTISGITMVMTSTSASVEANLVTFIVKNLLPKDAIVTFMTDTELYINVYFKWYIFQG